MSRAPASPQATGTNHRTVTPHAPVRPRRPRLRPRFTLPTSYFSILFVLLLASCDSPRSRQAQARTDSATAAPAAIEPFGAIDSTLYDSLAAIERHTAGRLGVAAIHLESGWRTSYRGAETFPMASVAKLPMAVRFLQLVDAGRFRLDSAVTLTPADHRPGASILYHRAMRDSAGRTSLHALLASTLIYSDNTSCDYLLRLSGGPAAVDSMIAAIGLGSIDVSHYEGELILMWAGIDPRRDTLITRDSYYARIQEAGKDTWELAGARMVDDPSDAAHPEQMTQLLELLQGRKLLSARSCDTLLAIMSRAVTGRGRIAGLLPTGTPVAHKTGTIGSTANDVGLITLPDGRGHLAISVFVKGSRASVRAREHAIASAAGLIYRYVMARPAKWPM